MEGSVGPWEKLKNLGAGGFGVVSLWRNSQTNDALALKMCRNNSGRLDSKTVHSWCKEVDKMKRLRHPNIIKILELPDVLKPLSKFPILCMEFCCKGDLRKELCKVENISGLSEESIRAILWDVKSGMEYLHSCNIIHRDIKPENIVMQEISDASSNTKVVYKLIDLGIAKEWDQNSLSSTFVGTLQYIAPELFSEQPYTRSVDFWSFGLVCHEIITGFRPFLPSKPISVWREEVKKKSTDHICIYETAEGDIVYQREIFPENHITQPLKYALEGWLRSALDWDGKIRGRSRCDNSLIIFSTLEAALNKKIVTVFCVKRLEKLSYEIDDSTQTGTLKSWIARDIEIPESSQVLLLPSGDTLGDSSKLLHPHLDNDPKLVAMLYVVSKEEGIKLPLVETLESKHPPLVRRMLESPKDSLSYDVVRRMWANSIFFVQSILDSYRAFIEAYSVKMLSLIDFQKKELLNLQLKVSTMLQELQVTYNFSKESLQIDLDNIKLNQFSKIVESNKDQIWKSTYRTINEDLSKLHCVAQQLLPEVEPILQQILKLQGFEEPGQVHCDKLSKLLTDSRRLYAGLMRIPVDERCDVHDSSSMVEIIFQLWKVISQISDDQAFNSHLQELSKIETVVYSLVIKLSDVFKQLSQLNDRLKCSHIDRQKEIWNIAKTVSNVAKQSGVRPCNEYYEVPQSLPRKKFIDLGGSFLISNRKNNSESD